MAPTLVLYSRSPLTSPPTDIGWAHTSGAKKSDGTSSIWQSRSRGRKQSKHGHSLRIPLVCSVHTTVAATLVRDTGDTTCSSLTGVLLSLRATPGANKKQTETCD
jgi:hypothetical protein